MTSPGATITNEGIRFAAWSSSARRLWVSIFDDAGEREIDRLELEPEGEGLRALLVTGLASGTRYGFRADGDYTPERGLWFDPEKLLTDPYAIEIDRPYQFNWRLAAKRNEGADTAALMPKAVVVALPQPAALLPPVLKPGGLIYELNVRSFTRLHP
ncbi:glycogen debranching enzyme GlgX, partial [Mesorhizobium sp. M4B.F.Ca.ET.049.02.1.2]